MIWHDVSGGATAAGTNVQIWQDYNNAAQTWQLIRK
ncbi:RICIN domain-containing protein [Paenibacillus sp. ATY16]|nr:RICIN domain-containing protein [Paenibacillus sp. ATY16]MCK9858882.1 RICIN domain-containing protein [Paenibacillus sp. ATY16]